MKPAIWVSVAALVLGAANAASAQKPCELRVSSALVGEWRDTMPSGGVEELVDELLASSKFVQLFASFINTRFNRGFAMRSEEDAVYYVVAHVLANELPWTDVFLGRFGWEGPGGFPVVVDDPNGLGYFTALWWMRRYAGNDTEGLMLFAAYRVVHNVTGLTLVPSPFNSDANANAVGRQRDPCRSCHLDSPLALDKIASLFPRREGFDARMTFTPPTGEPQELLAGQSFTTLRDFVTALTQTDDFRFFSCRLAFEYLYGRSENACEAPVFDACVDALDATDDIRAAIRAIVLDPSYCAP